MAEPEEGRADVRERAMATLRAVLADSELEHSELTPGVFILDLREHATRGRFFRFDFAAV